MAEEASWAGAIVAVEGPKAIVSTQLRLLPSSPQLLILPSLKNYIPKPASFLDVFDAITYIRQVNTALKRRHREAQEFLENDPGTTAGGKRLVFLDGGAASAQALCLDALMEHETDGDRAAAEAALRRLVHRGLAGLAQAGQERTSSDPFSYGGGIQDDESSDPSTRAMRAADALDRQTANLQTSNELDLTIRSHSRSSSLPLYGYSDTASGGEPAPFLVFGSSTSGPATPIQRPLEPATLETPRFSIVKYDQQVSMPPVFGFNDYSTRNSFASITEGPAVTPQTSAGHRRMESDAISPMSDAFSIGSLGKVEYGRASLLDVRKSAGLRGDLLAPLQTLSLNTTLQERKPSEETITQKTAACSHQNTAEEQSHESTPLESADGTTEPARAKSTTQRPRTITVKRSRPCVKLQPVPSPKKRRWQEGQTTFIDDESELVSARPDEAVYEPVFPQQEDLILYLRSERSPEPLIVSALNTMREEARRKSVRLSSSSKGSTATTESLKSLPQSDKGTVALTSPQSSDPTQEPEQITPKTAIIEAAPSISSVDDYDPFAYINPVFGQVDSNKQSKPVVTILRPPTPARTPSPPPAGSKDKRDAADLEVAVAVPGTDSVSDPDCGIHEIDVRPNQPPIAVQNLIRSVLRRHYPAESDDYTQFLTNEGLWHPLFRTHEASSNVELDGNQLKQILAVGLQNGVKREYSARVIAQIEKFGTEPTGAARCTRLDFRYLLANTMQAFLSHPLASSSKGNPFKHPNLLATLMLPHLETYLSMHSDIRFLILEYSTEHLPTVIAIQKLVGVDLVKIAQIVDTKSRERLPFRKIRDDAMSIASTNYTSSVYSQASSSSGSRYNSKEASSSTGVNTAKANFLLTSSASDKEVAEFVAAVWNLPVLDRRPQTAPAAEDWQTQNRGAAQVPLPPTPPKQQQEEPAVMEQQKPPPAQRRNKPAPLRVSTLSAFPKMTGPQSPLSPTSNIMSVLPPPSSPSPLSPSTTVAAAARRTWESSASTADSSGGGRTSVPISAVDGGSRLHGHVRSSTANTAVSVETIRAGNAPHIALMAPPSPNPIKLFDSVSGGSGGDDTGSSIIPRYLSTPSLADTLRRSPGGYDNDGASSIMTFDPAEESDYDQEERRLMPIFGKKRPLSQSSSKKALKVLGMTV